MRMRTRWSSAFCCRRETNVQLFLSRINFLSVYGIFWWHTKHQDTTFYLYCTSCSKVDFRITPEISSHYFSVVGNIRKGTNSNNLVIEKRAAKNWTIAGKSHYASIILLCYCCLLGTKGHKLQSFSFSSSLLTFSEQGPDRMSLSCTFCHVLFNGKFLLSPSPIRTVFYCCWQRLRRLYAAACCIAWRFEPFEECKRECLRK